MPHTPGIRRYIFNTLTVVSLLLMVATAGLWVDSYRQYVAFWGARSQPTDRWLLLENENGVFAVMSCRNQASFNGPSEAIMIRDKQAGFRMSDLAIEYHGLGFGTAHGNTTVFLLGQVFGVSFPHWFLTLIFAIAPAIWLIKWRGRRKIGPNACAACGYDLTGNETGNCPECGVENTDGTTT